MERRLTAFVLPALLVTAVLVMFQPDAAPAERPGPSGVPGATDPMVEIGQEPQRPQVQSGEEAPNEEVLFEHVFGQPGEVGSLHVVFDRRGGSVRSVRLLDEPSTPAARRKGAWSVDESYQLVKPVQKDVVSLSMAEVRQSGATRLGLDIERHRWEVRELEGDAVEFTLHDPATGLSLQRTYRHEPGRRDLRLSLSLVADAERPTEGKALELPAGSQCRVWLYGLSLINPSAGQILGNPAYAIGQVLHQVTGEPLIEVQRPDGKRNPSRLPRVAKSDRDYIIDFAGSTNRFFGAFLHPADEAAQEALWKVEMEKWPKQEPLPGHALESVPVANYLIDLKVPDAGGRTDLDFRLYIGPKSAGVFGEQPEYARYEAAVDVDLTPPCFCTIPGTQTMGSLLLWGLRNLYSLVGSWGVAIMLLTLIVRGSLVPLNFRMQKSMRAYGAKMTRLKPELDAIKARNESDPKKMQQEMVAFQRENKLFPPIGGCLPLLVTIPVFLGLFTALRIAYELRCQPFIGWIQDLSQPDQLFEIGLSWLPHFNLLPILMVVLWLILQSGTPLPNDPQQRQMMKIMRFMPVMFGIMLYNYAAGLMVYMVTSSLFGIIEQRVTKKILGPPPAVGGAAMPTF